MNYLNNNINSQITPMLIEIDGKTMKIFDFKTEKNISPSILYYIPDQYDISFASYEYKNINNINFGIIRNENLEYHLHGLLINRIDYINGYDQHPTYFYEGVIDHVEVMNRQDKEYWREKKLKRILE
ncbi:hypothetical protein M0Q97_12975 [Candidatus Dojkabacteria bacterium]|jgi:hypothetical protein|nr:hypothetical protein [Candidatus Dojkabacteria bacterium]